MDVKFMSMIFYRVMVMKLLETKPLHLFLIKKMKASLINIVRVHYQPYYSWAVSSCSKYKPPECEKWEVKEEGALKCIADFSCINRTRQLQFCGDALKDASAGNTIIIRDDDCCKVTRTFMRIVP